MTSECRPAEGTEDGTWHTLCYRNRHPVACKWERDLWWNAEAAEPCGSPEFMAHRGYTYLHPVTMPPRDLTREEMMEIAGNARERGYPAWGDALAAIARGTTE